MTSFVQYIPNASVYKNLDSSTKGRRHFYTAQIGKGDTSPSVKLVTPTQQAVERAKEDLKREKKVIVPSPGGINYLSPKPSKKKGVRKGSGVKKKKLKSPKNIHKKYKKK